MDPLTNVICKSFNQVYVVQDLITCPDVVGVVCELNLAGVWVLKAKLETFSQVLRHWHPTQLLKLIVRPEFLYRRLFYPFDEVKCDPFLSKRLHFDVLIWINVLADIKLDFFKNLSDCTFDICFVLVCFSFWKI